MNAGRWTIRGTTGRLVLLAVALLFVWPGNGVAYISPPAARLSETVADTFILGKDDIDWSYAEPDLILEEGDLLQTNETGRAEIQFEPGLTFRIGEGSRIALIETKGRKVVGIDSGRAYLRVSQERGEPVVLTFPSGQVTATKTALARVNVFDDGGAEVRVLRGQVELETPSQRSHIGTGERVMVNPQGVTEFSTIEFASRDGFDDWSEQRDIALSAYQRPPYIEQDIVGAENLEGYGEWVHSDRYGSYAWQPYVAEEWRPYYHGRWFYSDHYGWVWIPEEPWGYATYHYGSWNYDPLYGWVWIPGYVWRPSYVHWVVYDDYIGWVPRGYYGYPVITTYPYYVSSLHVVSYIDWFSFSFVFYDDFHRHHHHHHHHYYDDHDHGHHGHHDRDKHHDDEHHKGDRDGRNARDDYKNRRDIKTFPVDRGRHIDRGFIEKNKGEFRFVEDLRDETLKKTLHKGKTIRDRADFQRILAVDKHPQLQRRVAKLENARGYSENLRSPAAGDALPKKLERDKVKALDFRERVIRPHAQKVDKKAAPSKVRWSGRSYDLTDRARQIPAIPEVSRKENVTAKQPRQNLTEKGRVEKARQVADRQVQGRDRATEEAIPRNTERFRATPKTISNPAPERDSRYYGYELDRRKIPELNRNITHEQRRTVDRQTKVSNSPMRAPTRENAVREPMRDTQMKREIPRVRRNTDTRSEPVTAPNPGYQRKLERSPRIDASTNNRPTMSRSRTSASAYQKIERSPEQRARIQRPSAPATRQNIDRAPERSGSVGNQKPVNSGRGSSAGLKDRVSSRFGGRR